MLLIRKLRTAAGEAASGGRTAFRDAPGIKLSSNTNTGSGLKVYLKAKARPVGPRQSFECGQARHPRRGLSTALCCGQRACPYGVHHRPVIDITPTRSITARSWLAGRGQLAKKQRAAAARLRPYSSTAVACMGAKAPPYPANIYRGACVDARTDSLEKKPAE